MKKNVLVLSFLILSFFAGALSFPMQTSAVIECTGETINGICIPGDTGLSAKTVPEVVTNVMSWLLGILGTIAMLMFVIAGLQYLLAGGDEKNTESAKGNIKYAIIGVAVALLGYTILFTIDMLVTGVGI